MKALFAALVFISLSGIAIGDTAAKEPSLTIVEVSPAKLEVGPPVEAPLAAMTDAACTDVTEVTTPWAAFLAAYPALVFALKALANILGALALKGSGSAKAGVRIISQLLAWLGWFSGFLGTMGINRSESIKKMPLKKKKAA